MKKEFFKKRYLIPIIGFLAIVLILFFVWQSFFKKEAVSRPSVLPKIEIDFEVLESPVLEALESFEKIPLFEGEAGRENPFLAY